MDGCELEERTRIWFSWLYARKLTLLSFIPYSGQEEYEVCRSLDIRSRVC